MPAADGMSVRAGRKIKNSHRKICPDLYPFSESVFTVREVHGKDQDSFLCEEIFSVSSLFPSLCFFTIIL